ncbi:LacI family DNA-binding transcriptional regulator [Victivallis vadensis]|uniref:LacI family DNA-binding transcriptional regulator n=1 Tax=Victivallis vadensis TaxID=172901 RepID=UPI003D070D39
MTQKDIALKLNVSQATVSMALKGSPRISQALRDSVRKLVNDCGYRPNLAGQLLRRGRSNIIGAVFPSLRHGFHAELFQELQRQLLPQGYLLYLCCAESREELVSVAGYLKQLQVAGVVAIGSAAEVLLPLREAGIALVFYGGDAPLEAEVSQVLPDRRSAGMEMTRYLIGRGRRRIAFIGASNPDEPRFCGYRAALEEAGIGVDLALVLFAADAMGDGHRMMRQLLAEQPRVDAVFCHNDETAIGALRAASEAGIRVPEQLAVAGFDNIEAGRYFTPALTTVEQPRREITDALVGELLAALADPDHHRFVSIACRQVVRESA